MGPFYVQSPFYMEPFYVLCIKDSPHALYIKKTHNKIKQVTLLWDNFMLHTWLQ